MLCNAVRSQNLVEVGDDFVEKTKAFDAVVVQFGVELEEVSDRRKHHTDVVAVLIEQILDIKESRAVATKLH